MSVINIVLNAVDKYSSTLTGLNQGLEIVSKGFGLVKDAAGLAFDAVAKGVDIARVGGAFDEQRDQFENLAKSYKMNGQGIIDIVQQISGNTITEMQAISTATRIAAAGLRGKEMEDALLYAKKWSESTGGSFQQAAEQIATALTSGRYSTIKQMGLVIETGAKLEDVTKAISAGLQRFGDTGFNTADKLDALGVAQDDFVRKIGQGINQSSEFQNILGGVSDTVFDLVKRFNPQPISVFLDMMIAGGRAVADVFFNAFPSVGQTIDAVMTDSTGSVKRFSSFVVENVFGIVRSVADATNSILDILDGMGLVTLVELTSSAILQTVEFLGTTLTRQISGIVGVTIKGVGEVIGMISTFARSSPMLAESIGLDPVALADMENSFNRAAKGVAGLGDSFAEAFSAASEAGQRLTADVAQAARTQRFDLSAIDAYEKAAKDKLNNMDFSKEASEQAIKMNRATETIPQTTAEKVFEEAVEKTKKTQNEIVKATEKAVSSASKVAASEAAKASASFSDLVPMTPAAAQAYTDILNRSASAQITRNTGDLKTLPEQLQEQQKKTDAAGLSDSSILAALVRILKNALVGEAMGEGTPLVVFA